MKVSYKTLGGRLMIEFEAADTKGLVETLAGIQEVCEQEKCEHCGKNDFQFGTRIVEDDKYYELRCKSCHHQLGFGQSKKGNRLYPRRINHKTKQPIGKFGWYKFENQKDDSTEE
jgi:hypothetical protein